MKKLIIFFILFMLCGCSGNKSLEQKAARMLLVRCDENIEKAIDKGAGGVILFAKDFDGLSKDEVKNKTKAMKERAKAPLIVAVDEEGGTVVRVSSNPNLRHEKFKSPMEYYKEGGFDLLEKINTERAELLLDLGINLNLAPVADMAEENSFIYERTLGEDTKTTSEYVQRSVTTAKENGIMSCLKHFPGYGSNTDTHTGVSVDGREYAEFQSYDFLPFAAGIEAGAEFVMVSHNTVECVDPNLPVSLSSKWHKVLREEFGFGGVIITDDMAMDAVGEYENAYAAAVACGNDMLIVSDFDGAVAQIVDAVKSGEIEESVLDKAIENIEKIMK